ncbi:MAG: hypothetical protein HY907_22800 [Deltaproteobacteria bacterium]|nr:hypothetical protein [Deltaproteobacteria bacterium]
MSNDNRPENGTFRIKKYGNRRLYDTHQSRYITLEELAGIIQEGAAVRVADAASGKDITRQVLTQVILERQEALDMLPVELLHVIIRTQGTIEQAPFAAFLAAFTRQIVTAGQLWTQPVANFLRGLAHAVPGVGAPVEPPPASEPATGDGTPEADEVAGDETGATPTRGEEPPESASAAHAPPGASPPSGEPEPGGKVPAADGLRPRIERLLRKLGAPRD